MKETINKLEERMYWNPEIADFCKLEEKIDSLENLLNREKKHHEWMIEKLTESHKNEIEALKIQANMVHDKNDIFHTFNYHKILD